MNSRAILSNLFTGITVAVVTSVFWSVTYAETSPAPISGVDSRIEELNANLVELNYGSESAGSWGNWGAVWNRIRSAAEWAPEGDASQSDVLSGKVFYSDSRTLLTGSAALAMDYSLQQYNETDDYHGIDLGNSEDYLGDEAEWVNTLPLSGGKEVWQDKRTGLYWSHDIGTSSNIFPDVDHSTCGFFSADPRGSYNGTDLPCGNAINSCANLELDRDGDSVDDLDWYLPTQKELMQAYIDGIYNQTSADFATTNYFWSSTESPNDSRAWDFSPSDGYQDFTSKTFDLMSVRCVSRDTAI